MEYIIFIAVIIGIFIIWFISGVRLEHQRKRRFREKLLHLEGTMPDKKYHPEHFLFAKEHIGQQDGKGGIDDITWNDLSMDEIFKRMDYTYCAAGEEMLYRMLRTPVCEEGTLKHRGEIIRYFEENRADRVRYQLLFAKIGRTGRYSIYEYLDYLEALPVRGNLMDILALGAMLAAVGAIFVDAGVGTLCLIGLVVYNFASYLKIKGEIWPYITTLSYIMRMLQNTSDLVKDPVPVFMQEAGLLQRHAKVFDRFKRGAFLVTRTLSPAGDPAELVLDYVCMIFHIDLMKFNSMHKMVATHHDELKEMFETIGMMEAMISVALYRKSLSGYCEPELTGKGEAFLSMEEVYHPLLKNPVKNSITCKKGVLLTGSNASGKSTFLKTVAVNAILAQSVYTCTAESFSGSYFRVYSSMSLRDDLMAGDSYFIVEIKTVKRILDACQDEKTPVLCFVDELLRGTNTVERIAASTEILKALQKSNALCFAATHDLELTKLLEGQFDNYHFEEKLVDGDVIFAYQLLFGEATTRNAIELLRILGFSEEIIGRAHESAGEYLARESLWGKGAGKNPV